VIISGAVIVIALIAANIYLYTQIDGLKQQLVQVQGSLSTEVSRVQETGKAGNAAAQKTSRSG
jgi:uncharacterized protein YoxC